MKDFNAKRLITGFTIVLCMLQWQVVLSQKFDYIWLSGNDSKFHNIHDPCDSLEGVVKLDFNQNPVQVSFDSIATDFQATDVCFSDSNGNLLFYSNGTRVVNAHDNIIENGDSLNFGYLLYDDAGYTIDTVLGDVAPQGIIALPNPASGNQYYLVYAFGDTTPFVEGGGNYVAKILTALVDMQANGGLGQIIYKDSSILEGVGELGESVPAVKHGNGRDWWLLAQKRNTNCFYEILLDSSGPHVTDTFCLGPTVPSGYQDQSCFSPDGSKFAYFANTSGLSVYDFDRCTGKLSNAKYLSYSDLKDTARFVVGIAISPNSRFLYASLVAHLYQLDLWNDNLLNSLDTIGIFESLWNDCGTTSPSTSGYCQLAPDGKIYITGIGGAPFYHVINNPDEQGSTCNLVQYGLSLPTLEEGIPNYPNYRLGALTQSQCDTLASLTAIQRAAKEQIIKVYPNPATDYAVIDYGFTDWSKAQPNLEICNTLGQVVHAQILPMYSGLQKIDVSTWAGGMYTVYIKRNGGVIARSKFVKQ
jgi:hypothetical protein